MARRTVITFVLLSFTLIGSAQTPAKIDSLKGLLSSVKANSLVDVLNYLCWEYRFVNADTARIYGKRALNLANEHNYKEGSATAFSNLGVTFEAQGKFDSALNYHENALSLKRELRDTLEVAGTLNNMGIAYDELGNHLTALEYYFEALRYYEHLEEPLQMAKVLSNIGIVYRKQGEFEKVLEYYLQAYQLYREQGSEFGQAVLEGNIGVVYINLKNYPLAQQYSKRSLKGYHSLGLKQYIPYALFNNAIIYDSLHVRDSAENFYLQAIEQFTAYNNQQELANTMAHLSNFYCKIDEHAKAVKYGREALSLSKKIGARDIELRSLRTLATAYAESGQFQQSYTYISEHNQLRDTLFEARKTKQIFELQTQYETEKKELEIANQKLELVRINSVVERNRLLQIGMGGLILFLVIIGLLLRNRFKINQERKLAHQKTESKAEQLNAVISSQEAERKRFAMDLHDGFGQFISALRMNLSRLEKLGKTQFDERDTIVSESENVLSAMHTEIRNVAFNLMPTTLANKGLVPALKEFCSRLNRSGDIVVTLQDFGLEDRLTDILEVSLYRIIQEWVTNVTKYASASKIEIQLVADENDIRVSIEDNGKGFDPEKLKNSKGHGWRNINSRLNLIHGEIDIDSAESRVGTSIFINSPLVYRKQSLSGETRSK